MVRNILLLLLCSKLASAQTDSVRTAHIGFVYPLSTNGIEAKQYYNGGSFHAIAGVSAGEKAFCLSGVSNVVTNYAHGFIMAGVVNYIGGNADGMQIAGVTNFVGGRADGFQIAGFNNVAQNANGMQMAGFSNVCKNQAQGLQLAGFSNIAQKADNQIAGFCNVARKAKGIQAAGFANVVKQMKGAQIAGFSNVAKNVDGIQIAGFCNLAKKVKGVQISGFINIADSCDYPIGLVNIIHNGEQYIGLSYDETRTGFISLRSGSKKLYGILGAGLNTANAQLRYGIEAGMGMHIPLSLLFRIKTEFAVSSLTDFKNGVYMKSTARLLPSMRFGRSFELFVGPTFSFSNYPKDLGDPLNLNYVWKRRSKGTFYGMNIGAIAGVQVRL